MDSYTYFLIQRSNSDFAIRLIHYANNFFAAKNAMLNAYGLSDRNIVTWSSSPAAPIWARTKPCTDFDGRNAH